MVKNDWIGIKGYVTSVILSAGIIRDGFGKVIFSNKQRKAIKETFQEKLKEGGHFVDLGAGPGYYTFMALNTHESVKATAVDLSEIMLKVLKGKILKNNISHRVKILEEDVTNTTINDNSADLIMAANILHELKEPKMIVKEMSRLLKKDGIIIVTEFLDTDFGKKVLDHHNDQVHGPFSIDKIEKIFKDEGFQKIQLLPDKNRVLGIISK